MQKVSSTLYNVLTAPNQQPRRFSVVIEIYHQDAEPGPSGFNPSSPLCLKRFAKTIGIKFCGVPYQQLLTGFSSVNKQIKKELSNASFTLANNSRAVARFEKQIGFEGKICVIRLIDRLVSSDVEDSVVWFTGRCKKPSAFVRNSESVQITAEQILNQTEVVFPRRKFQPEDRLGRAPSDPLYEGIRISPRTADVRFTERVRRGGLLGAFGLSKNVTRFVQYSSHSDVTANRSVPLILGRASTTLIHLSYLDYGSFLHGTGAISDGEIKAVSNVRPVTPGFTLPATAIKLGKPGIAGAVDTPTGQANDDPDWVGAGILSRLAHIRYAALGTKIDVEDPAPEIALIVLGNIVPLPDASGAFTLKDWTDNPVFLTRWALNSPDYFNLSDAWFNDAANLNSADYCDHVLVDQSNSDTVAYHQSEAENAGTAYQNYAATSRINPSHFRFRSGEIDQLLGAYMQPADYRFYDDGSTVGDDWDGDGIPDYLPADIPTALRRRWTLNLILSEEMKGIDFVYDVMLASFNGFLAQEATGKFAIKARRPADFSFIRIESAPAAGEIAVWNINPFRLEKPRIVIGAHLPVAEVRRIVGARYDTIVSIPITATGGASVNAPTLAGGTNDIPPSAVVTVFDAGFQKHLNIDGFDLFYTAQTGETTSTAAGAVAALVNSHNVLNKYVKAEWTGGDTVKISSRIGFLELDAPLRNKHLTRIGDPAAPPNAAAAASASGFLVAGNYLLCFSYVTAEGETLTSPTQTVTVSDNGKIDVPAMVLPARVLELRWYLSAEPNGIRLRRIAKTAGESFSIRQTPRLNGYVEPVINATGEELHRVEMAFTDRADTSSNLRASNMIKGSFQFSVSNGQPSKTGVSIAFRDAAEDFQFTELKVIDEELAAKTRKPAIEKINGAGVDSTHQARRLANQRLAVLTGGDAGQIFASDGEALLLEEGDVITATEESGDFKNASLTVEAMVLSDDDDYASIKITAKPYRRSFFDDQIREKLVPLSLITPTEPNTETQAPRIYQSGAAEVRIIPIGVESYTTAAKFRKVQIDLTGAFASPVQYVIEAAREPGGVLASNMQIARPPEITVAETKYVRVAHSSNGRTFGTWSNVLMISYPDASGGGGTATGEPEAPSNTGGGRGPILQTEQPI